MIRTMFRFTFIALICATAILLLGFLPFEDSIQADPTATWAPLWTATPTAVMRVREYVPVTTLEPGAVPPGRIYPTDYVWPIASPYPEPYVPTPYPTYDPYPNPVLP